MSSPSLNGRAPRRRASRTDIDPLLGQVIDKDFEIERPLGGGSHADVFLARQHSVGGRVVALKILCRPYLALRESDFRRASQALLREGELLGKLHSSCFVDVYRTGILPDERPYLAMEYIEGRTLQSILEQDGPMEVDAAIDILTELCTGLAELHRNGLVHRDVTPANMMVTISPTASLRVKMFDFGTVTRIATRADRHRVGYDPDHPLGTAAYMAPEQAAAGVVDGRADQFAVGAIAYEMLTGVRAYSVVEPGPKPLLDYLRGDGPIPIEPIGALRSLPTRMELAVERALRRDPDQRFADVVGFVEELISVRRQAFAATGRPNRGLLRRWLRGQKRGSP